MRVVVPFGSSRRLPALACTALLAAAPSALAEPMSIQEAVALRPASAANLEQPGVSAIRPYYDEGLDHPFDRDRWRIGYAREVDDRPEIPTGIIASIGRLGLRIDSSGDGPAVNGLAWSPSPNVSFVAGGSISGGIGASLSVRLSF